MENLVVKAFNLKKSFNKTIVFDKLNFAVSKGEIVAIVGPSGCGKSTLLRCLVGLEKVDTGTILIDDIYLVKDGKYCSSRLKSQVFSKVGIVFQNYELFENLTVLQNLLIVESNYDKAHMLLERFGLIDRSSLHISKLSGGQKQRLAIIRALIREPKILFFDEPTSALDSVNSDEVAVLINELSAKNYPIVIVTHDMPFVNNLDCRVFDLTKV